MKTHLNICRPCLELLEARLPPGDTLLGLLVPQTLFESTLSDSSFPKDSSFILHPSSFPNESVVNTVPTWPRTWNDISLCSQANSNATFEFVATLPGVHGVVPRCDSSCWGVPLSADAAPGRASWRRDVPPRVSTPSLGSLAAITSFPTSGSGTPVRETPFRGSAGDETEFRGPAFPNGSSGTSVGEANYGSLPFYFEQNVGQADKAFDFVARGKGYTVGLSATEAVFSLASRERQRPEVDLDVGCVKSSQTHRDFGAPVRLRGLDVPYEENQCSPDFSEPRPLGSEFAPLADARGSETILRMQLVGANAEAHVTGVDQLVTKINYFLGNDPNEWHTNIATFAKVQYDDVYPGIDLVYYGDGSDLEYDFIVAPGANPDQIQLNFSGADRVEIDPAGNLVLQTGDTELRQQKPYIYQEVNGTRREVAGEFRIQNSELRTQNSELKTQNLSLPDELNTQNSKLITFDIRVYDPSRPLVIDPVIAYSTFLGGSGSEYATDVATDQAGNAYVTGLTYSANFPLVNPVQNFNDGDTDVFITKFNASGTAILFSTYLGGDWFERGEGIAVHTDGSVFVVGGTMSGDFPTTAGAFQTHIGSGCTGSDACADAFVAKLAPDGAALTYSTFLGGNTQEWGDGIAVDRRGNAFVVGLTNSVNFPKLGPGVDKTYGGGICGDGGSHPCFDAFVTKLNSSGTTQLYSTYIGGNRDEGLDTLRGAIAVDRRGYAIITGSTNASNGSFPIHNAIQPTYAGGDIDAFITKLTPNGSAYVYSTFFGGSQGERGNGVATDDAGNAYVVGTTGSPDFPLVNPLQALLQDRDAFVMKLSANGSTLFYSTYLGGNDSDWGYSMAVDKAGSVYVAGFTYSVRFPVSNAFQPAFGGTTDAFVSKLHPSGNQLVFSSYLGGAGGDFADGIAVNTSGDVYVVGGTRSSDFPAVNPLQTYAGGYDDAFVTKIGRTARIPMQASRP